MSAYLAKEPCPKCGSKDNLARYDDGHGFCFGCGYYEAKDGQTGVKAPVEGLLAGEPAALKKRGITLETAQKWRYLVGHDKGQPVQLATYYKDGRAVAQKVRYPDKTFRIVGDPKQMTLYGQWLWRDTGRMVVVTEGEVDALSASQAMENKWPVVSVPNGAQGAERAVRKALDWLEGFERVVFAFDMDEPGQDAARACAALLTPGKAFIADLPEKDANDCLREGKVKDLVSAFWQAKAHRPDGIVGGDELWSSIVDGVVGSSVPYPWAGLQAKALGLRTGEIVTLTSGSGVGKSTICRELAHHLLTKTSDPVGYLGLEESPRRTALGLIGVEMQRPLHLVQEMWSDPQWFAKLPDLDRAAFRAAYDKTVGSGRFYLYDHFGSMAIDNLLSRVRYMAQGLGCKWVFLDHLSIVISGLEGDDERRLIDHAMTALRSLVEQTHIGLILVSHLRRPKGDDGHEGGAETRLAHLRGSHSIAQLSDAVIGVERDQQAEEETRDVLLLRSLKQRFSGLVGPAGKLRYDRKTGRLIEEGVETKARAHGFQDEEF